MVRKVAASIDKLTNSGKKEKARKAIKVITDRKKLKEFKKLKPTSQAQVFQVP